MATRRAMDNYQSAGFGGLSFATNLNFVNLPMSYEQRLWALEGLYAFALAKIEEDPKYNKDPDTSLLIAGIRIMLTQAGDDYKTEYESHKSLSKQENNYRTLLCQIFEKITELQGRTKMIERVREEQVDAG